MEAGRCVVFLTGMFSYRTVGRFIQFVAFYSAGINHRLISVEQTNSANFLKE